MCAKPIKKEPRQVETTGHQWDGIEELNNPMPRWWVWTFYAYHRLGDRLHDRLPGLASCDPGNARRTGSFDPGQCGGRDRRLGCPQRRDQGASWCRPT